MVAPELTSITPPPLDTSAITSALTSEARRIQEGISGDFHRTTATWNHKPAFKSLPISGASEIVMDVFTSDDIYAAVNSGTKVRVVYTSKKAFPLPGTYLPKTLPGVIDSFRTGSTGGTQFVSGTIGLASQIEPRNFDTAIANKWRPIIPSRLQKAMDEAAKKVNHSL